MENETNEDNTYILVKSRKWFNQMSEMAKITNGNVVLHNAIL